MKLAFWIIALLIFAPPVINKIHRMKRMHEYKQWRKYQDANKIK